MILASIYVDNIIGACVIVEEKYFLISELSKKFNLNISGNIFEILNNGELGRLKDWFNQNKDKILTEVPSCINKDEIQFAPLYKNPRKIWGIGLNYADHAKDLSEKTPEEIPASFMKPDTTIIGYMETIKIPKMSEKTTGEAELGIIIGKECYDIEKENWIDYVAGFTTIIDMTAEDILRKNPRYLTLSKSFETFFSFGPYFLTPDELSDLKNVKVSTVINNQVWAENTISNMTFPPDFLVSFHSKVMKLLPGDIISTGTPKATPLKHKDIVECRITNFQPLINPVVDLKK
jgi:2-keto-4-pentenoate hydratase/2-oxohepta-3-ene-1,7-dioic acid hydratase in catechol pathway